MSTYEDHISKEIDRWIAVQLKQAPELRGDVVDALWQLLRESASSEAAVTSRENRVG